MKSIQQKSTSLEANAPELGQTPLWLDIFFALLTAAYAVLFVRQPSPFFADDSFFYLQVGRNFALGYGSTFNRLMQTNGYHPVWMLMCAAVYKVFPNRIIGLHMIAALIVLLNIVVLVVAAKLLRRVQAPAWVAWTILIPFLFGLQLGTESSLSAAMLAGTLLALYKFFEHPDWKSGFAFNVLAAFSVLSRLDSIFVIACVWIAVLFWCLRQQTDGKRALRIHLAWIPLYAVLWGAYLGSNLFWFDILMPISGLLKSSNSGDHAFGHNLPHTALISLIVCAISIAILWRRQRDRWFLFAELPFFIGILMHAAYITLRMTGETRWTWYYVSWALLAALTASRAAVCLFRAAPAAVRGSPRRPSVAARLRSVGILLAIVFSALLWYKMGWQHSREQVAEETTIPVLRQVLNDDHLDRLLAYDQPGGMAYFTDASVVPLDGLMADREFQTELARKGIGEFIRRDSIDGFAGPTVPFDEWGKDTYCGHLFLESTKYTCEPWMAAPDGRPQWMITGVEVYSRIPLAPAGYISLPPSHIVWTGKNYVTIWRVSQADSQPKAEASNFAR